jgi:hypothetical protein
MTVETNCKSHTLFYAVCGHIYLAEGSHFPVENHPCNQQIIYTIDYESAECDCCAQREAGDETKLPDHFKKQPSTGIDVIDMDYFESEMADLSSFWERATTANRNAEKEQVEIKRKLAEASKRYETGSAS